MKSPTSRAAMEEAPLMNASLFLSRRSTGRSSHEHPHLVIPLALLLKRAGSSTSDFFTSGAAPWWSAASRWSPPPSAPWHANLVTTWWERGVAATVCGLASCSRGIITLFFDARSAPVGVLTDLEFLDTVLRQAASSAARIPRVYLVLIVNCVTWPGNLARPRSPPLLGGRWVDAALSRGVDFFASMSGLWACWSPTSPFRHHNGRHLRDRLLRAQPPSRRPLWLLAKVPRRRSIFYRTSSMDRRPRGFCCRSRCIGRGSPRGNPAWELHRPAHEAAKLRRTR